VTVAGPCAKILLGEFSHQDRIEPKRPRRLDRPSCRAGVACSFGRQMPSHGIQRRPIAQLGRSVCGMDHSIDPGDGRVPDQPKKAFPFHLISDDSPADRYLVFRPARFCR